MTKPNYITITKESPIFEQVCDYCDRIIVEENHRKNGGTLNYSGIVYDSDYLIVCLDVKKPIAFNSLVELDECLYIYQIAVKNDRKRQGIATKLMNIAISLAEKKNKTVTVHVRAYNIASNHLFKKLGFDAPEPSYNTLYILTKKKKTPNNFTK